MPNGKKEDSEILKYLFNSSFFSIVNELLIKDELSVDCIKEMKKKNPKNAVLILFLSVFRDSIQKAPDSEKYSDFIRSIFELCEKYEDAVTIMELDSNDEKVLSFEIAKRADDTVFSILSGNGGVVIFD